MLKFFFVTSLCLIIFWAVFIYIFGSDFSDHLETISCDSNSGVSGASNDSSFR